MAITVPPVNMYPGEDKLFVITIYQSDDVTPQDITGWNLQMTIHKDGDPSTVYVTKDNTLSGGLIIVNATGGVINVTLVASDTVNMAPDIYTFKLERINIGFNAVLTVIPFNLLVK